MRGEVGKSSKIVPCKAELYLAPIECPYLAEQYRVSSLSSSSAKVGNLKLGNLNIVSQEVLREPYSCENLSR